MANKVNVAAGEMGEYVYCRRSWWLKFKGYTVDQTVEMERGAKAHNEIYENISGYPVRIKIAYLLLGSSVVLLLLLILLTLVR